MHLVRLPPPEFLLCSAATSGPRDPGADPRRRRSRRRRRRHDEKRGTCRRSFVTPPAASPCGKPLYRKRPLVNKGSSKGDRLVDIRRRNNSENPASTTITFQQTRLDEGPQWPWPFEVIILCCLLYLMPFLIARWTMLNGRSRVWVQKKEWFLNGGDKLTLGEPKIFFFSK